MITNIAIQAGLLLFVYVLQGSFIINLPTPFSFLNLPLLALIIVTYVFGYKNGLVWAVILGVLAGQTSNLSTGSEIAANFIIVNLISLLSDNVLTNRSLYSNSVLCLIGSALFVALTYGFNFSYFNATASTGNIFSWATWGSFLNILASGIVFTGLTAFYKELKSYILTR